MLVILVRHPLHLQNSLTSAPVTFLVLKMIIGGRLLTIRQVLQLALQIPR